MKNAESRRSRLKKKARQLTDEDLVRVMMWRKEAKEKKNVDEEIDPEAKEKENSEKTTDAEPENLVK